MNAKQLFERVNLRDFRQTSYNDLDLWYSYAFMHSFSQLFVPSLTSKTSIVSIKFSVKSFFPYKSIREQSRLCRKES